MIATPDAPPVPAFRGNPTERDIAAILVALAVATAPVANSPADADDQWGTPELIVRRHMAAISTLPYLTAGHPADRNPGRTS